MKPDHIQIVFAVCVSIEDYIIELIRQLQEINQNYRQILNVQGLYCRSMLWFSSATNIHEVSLDEM